MWLHFKVSRDYFFHSSSSIVFYVCVLLNMIRYGYFEIVFYWNIEDFHMEIKEPMKNYILTTLIDSSCSQKNSGPLYVQRRPEADMLTGKL